MAKTRSQSHRERQPLNALKTSAKLSKKLKTERKTIVAPIRVPSEMLTCCVKLDRLTPEQINDLTQGKKKYALRKRPSIISVDTIPKPKKPLGQIVALSQAALYTSKASRIWDHLKKDVAKKTLKLDVDQIVCARMAGHRPWPAKIESFGKSGVNLLFFGTHNRGPVKKAEVIPYEMCKEMLEQFLKVPLHDLPNKTQCYHMSFVKACREVSCFEDAKAKP